jgi:hypothetical protein
MRNPDVRERLLVHEKAFRDAVARFIDEQTAAMGITLSISARTLADIVVPATLGFAEYSHLDDGNDDPFAAFLDLVIGAVTAPPAKRSRPS